MRWVILGMSELTSLLQALEPPNDLEDHIDDLLLAEKPKVYQNPHRAPSVAYNVFLTVYQGGGASRLFDRRTS